MALQSLNSEDLNERFSENNVLALPFPNKLWVTASLERVLCINWSPSGNNILVDLDGLQEHLSSTHSIFHEKDDDEFVLCLIDHGFEAVKNDEPTELIQFNHKYFNRDRVEYLCLITDETSNRKPDRKTIELSQFDATFRMQGDPCFRKYGTITPLQYERAKLRAGLAFRAKNNILSKCYSDRLPEGISIPTHVFKNPADSVFMIECGKEKYAGYYGETNNKELENFFGEYIPKYIFSEHPKPEE